VTIDGGTPSLLEEQALEYLRLRGQEVEYAEGDIVLRRGQTDPSFWVILRGEVEVVIRAGDGVRHSLLRLGPGETLGELAILRSAPMGADVVAVTALTLLRYPGEYLPTALAECEPLRRALLARMAHNVIQRTTESFLFYQQSRTMADLHQGRLPSGTMIANSARMRAVVARMNAAAQHDEPVLITGEFGTGKVLTARLIHSESSREPAPVIAVDCGELSAKDANRMLFGTSAASNADLSAERFGTLHLAHGGSLVLRGIEALTEETQRELANHLQADREVESTPFPDVRIIATTDTNAVGPGGSVLIDELREEFETVIELPTLAERPRDIVDLAHTFLREADDTGQLQLTPSAEKALVSLKYRHRNVEELRSVVELAARVAEGHELRAEHIFSGFDNERPVGLDVSRFWLVRWLVDGGGLGFSRSLVAVGFVAAALVCLFASGSLAARTANGAVWMLWEPVVFGLFLLVGSLWCTVCPLSSGGRAVQRIFSLDRPPPPWILRTGTMLSAAGLVLILWSEEFFHMFTTPFATGMLLFALIGSAVVCCVLWQREVWCRHLCPLGRLGVALSPVAPLTVAARRSICASTCTTHDCYKGNEDVPGCPVWHHPQLVSEAHRCKTCLTCLQSCPHESAGLYLRPRLRSAWRLDSTESYVVAFALTVFFLSPVLILIQKGGVLAEPLWMTVACWLTVVAAALVAPALSPALQAEGRSTALAAATACALLVLGWGPLMAYQMEHIPFFETLVVVSKPGTWWARWPGPAVTTMTLLRVAWVVFAAVLSAIILWNANGLARKSGIRIRTWGWTLLIIICTVYTFGALWLVAG
jgi:CRP-like cAMP-binding protein/polyferredoxin